jgi:uncharacterized protein
MGEAGADRRDGAGGLGLGADPGARFLEGVLWNAAALGLMDRLEAELDGPTPPSADEVTNAFWCACHGGQRPAAEYLLSRGADLEWVGHDHLSALDAARRSGADALAEWLVDQGAKPAGHAA